MFYTLFCIERCLYGLFRPVNKNLFSSYEQVANKVRQIMKKESLSEDEVELTIIHNLEVMDDGFLDPSVGVVTIRTGSFFPLIPSGYIYAIFSFVYYYFLQYIFSYNSDNASMFFIVISLILGYFVTQFFLPEKKWLFYFVKFEIERSNRKKWHVFSLILVIMSFVFCGLGANLFYLLKIKGM